MKFLEKLGYNPDLAEDGMEAIVALKNQDYDLIFMDMQMPVMDGITATKKIRKTYPSKKLKIVAMTANVFDEDRRKCLEAGMDEFIPKPVNMKKLTETIKQMYEELSNGRIAG